MSARSDREPQGGAAAGGITARAAARLAGRPALAPAHGPSRAVARARAGASRKLADRLLRRRLIPSAFGSARSPRFVFRLPHRVVRAEAGAREASALPADLDVSSAPDVVAVGPAAGRAEVARAHGAAAADSAEMNATVVAGEATAPPEIH